MNGRSFYGAVLHRSPAPMCVVGYYYVNGHWGKRQEVYRVPVEESQYRSVVERIHRVGGSLEQMDTALFLAFKPQNA